MASTDQADQAEVVYLRSTTAGPASQQVYRFEAAPTYQIQFQVTDQPQVITTGDETYRSGRGLATVDLLQPVRHPLRRGCRRPGPGGHLRTRRFTDGRWRRHRRVPAAGRHRTPGPETVAAAEQAGLNPDLTIGGQHYVLVDIYTPIGTTRNGFMTLFATSTEAPEMVLGRDQRELGLLVFDVDPAEVRPGR